MDSPKIASSDLVKASNLAVQYAGNGILINRQGARDAFFQYEKMLSQYHPVLACQTGAKYFTRNFKSLWPPKNEKELDFVARVDLQVASKNIPAVKQCNGIEKENFEQCKGYTCGLWQTLHGMALRVPKSFQYEALITIRNFLDHFFLCDECRAHFLQEADSELQIYVNNKKDLSLPLFLWRTHNQVNQRNNAHLKTPATGPHPSLFPQQNICKNCWNPAQESYEDGEVLLFLETYYGVILSENKASPIKHNLRVSEPIDTEFQGLEATYFVLLAATVTVCWLIASRYMKKRSHKLH